MPTNELFSFEVLVNGQPLKEYIPEEEDYVYPAVSNLSESDLDRVSYVEASPGSEFSIRVTYVGGAPLSTNLAYSFRVFVDGTQVEGRVLLQNIVTTMTFNAMRVSGGMEQT
jgi:archaellum component FlaF (FlaF/FlaG flagellin family)